MKRPGNEAWHNAPAPTAAQCETQDLQILELWDGGHSMAAISARLGLRYNAVNRIISMYCGTQGHDEAAIRAATRQLGEALQRYRGPAPRTEPVALVTPRTPMLVTPGGDGPLTRGPGRQPSPSSLPVERAAA